VKILPGGCRVFTPDDGQAGSAGGWRWRTPICRANGADRITQSVSEFSGGRAPVVVNPQAEEALYVVEGEGVCYIDGWPYPVSPGIAIYVPPAAEYCFENTGEAALRVLHACCPEDFGRHFVETPRVVETPRAADSSATPNDAPKRTVREVDRELIPAGADRHFRYLVHTDLGCRQITQFAGWIPTSKAIPHTHTYEEGIFILSGRGLVHVDGDTCEFETGSSIYFPIGVRHCIENAEAAPIRLLGAFYPSGSPGAAYED